MRLAADADRRYVAADGRHRVFDAVRAHSGFGVFATFMIMLNYILVITWFPACVVVFHYYFEDRPFCCACVRDKKEPTEESASR